MYYCVVVHGVIFNEMVDRSISASSQNSNLKLMSYLTGSCNMHAVYMYLVNATTMYIVHVFQSVVVIEVKHL